MLRLRRRWKVLLWLLDRREELRLLTRLDGV